MALTDFLSNPGSVNGAGTALDVIGQIIGAQSHIQFGQQAREAAQFQADQMRQNAGQAQAASQRQAYNADIQTKLVMSRALAVAAASGGGASDPTVVNTMARIASEGAYRKAVALYQGDEAARRMEMQAQATEYQGKETQANSNLVGASQFLSAGTSLMRGMARGASLRQKYGGDGPAVNGDAKPAGQSDGWGN